PLGESISSGGSPPRWPEKSDVSVQPSGSRQPAGRVSPTCQTAGHVSEKMKLSELASRLGLELRGDGGIEIAVPAPIEAAGPGTITFVAAARYLPALRASRASCVIVPEALAAEAQCAALISRNPHFDFARVLEIFFPPIGRRPESIRPPG